MKAGLADLPVKSSSEWMETPRVTKLLTLAMFSDLISGTLARIRDIFEKEDGAMESMTGSGIDLDRQLRKESKNPKDSKIAQEFCELLMCDHGKEIRKHWGPVVLLHLGKEVSDIAASRSGL